VDGDEREKAGDLKCQAEAHDGEGVVGEAVADAGGAPVPVVRAAKGLRRVVTKPRRRHARMHSEAIVASLPAVLGSFNLKTTGEGMGFVGRGEGAVAVATLAMSDRS
jgi:hypothetical protein